MLGIYTGDTEQQGAVGYYDHKEKLFYPLGGEGLIGYPAEEKDLAEPNVRVHMNLRKKQFNISTYVKGKGWRKAALAHVVYLHDVTFKVSEAGRQRAIRQGIRNVHAYAYGTLMPWVDLHMPLFGATQVSYNPFKHAKFVLAETAIPVHSAEEVLFSVKHGVQAWGICVEGDDCG